MPAAPGAFAARLAALMREAGVSVADLARKARLPRQTLHKLLRGERQPSLDTAARLARALGSSLAAFDGVTDARSES